MSFVHDDVESPQLVGILARKTGIAAALIEKEYWVTHTLWALHETGLEVWFKGGTSLSKGFSLIQRFSEDLYLMIQHGSVEGLPEVTSWTSKDPEKTREAFYAALAGTLAVPGVRVKRDESWIDERARGADYLGYYPAGLIDQLAPAVSPFVRLEVGRPRVVPHVERRLGSFVRACLVEQDMLAGYAENRPTAVR